MRTFEEIRQLAIDLQNRRTAVLQYMIDIKRHYEAEWVVPLPDTKNEPDMAQFTPSLITDTIDGLGMRAASTMFNIHTPAVSMSQAAGKRATTRRKVLHSTYEENRMKIKMRRYYRHLCAYDTGAFFVDPCFKTNSVRINVRDPLTVYPEPTSADLVKPPSYVAFIQRHSGASLRNMYPKVREENGGPIAAQEDHEEWDLLEWVDEEQITFGLLGPREIEGKHIAGGWRTDQDLGTGPWMQLGTMRNLAGVCLAITPQEISLHSVGTRLNALLGNVEWQTKLMAMEVEAQQRAIFPDMFVISNPNETPRLLNGEWSDGRTGRMNMLQGVANVGQISQTPDVRTQSMIDRLERNTRVSGGLNPQMGGESFGSLRTGRALDQMMASSVDPRIQELHEVTEAWMPHVNEAIFATYEGWFSDKTFEFFTGWGNDEIVKFTPSEDVDTRRNTVEYAVPGADVIQLTQILGSMLGAKAISTETFQSQHPWIKDALAEQQRVVEEDLFKAMVAGVQEQIATGQMPMSIIAKLYDKVKTGTELPQAIAEIDEEIRQQQAEAAAAQQAAAQADPLAQMGLAAGPAAAAPTAVGPGPEPAPLQPGGPNVDMQALLSGALGGA